MKKVRFSLAVPEDLWRKIKEMSDNVSGLIAEAMCDYVSRARLRRALKETAGAWTDENHSDLQTLAEIEAYVRDIRYGWRRD